MAMIRVRVRGLVMDERTKSPIVILQEDEGERLLPIWIGEAEARSIGMVLARESLERPLTHDLAVTLLKSLGARIVAVTITSLKENTFFAEIHLESRGERILVDARPSDSIAIALRTDAAIFVDEEVLTSGQASGMSIASKPKSEKEKAAELRKLLENMDPGDFGRFGL